MQPDCPPAADGSLADGGVAVGTRVVIDGLVSRADLNGQLAAVIEWVDAKGRWRVRCDSGELLGVQPSNLRVAPQRVAADMPTTSAAEGACVLWVGAQVTLHGLTARPELNGRAGVVDGQRNAERWSVQLVTPEGMRDGQPIALKPANLSLMGEPPASHRLRGSCLVVGPAPLESARHAIPVHVAAEPIPVDPGPDAEAREKRILRGSRGWNHVVGLKAYTKAATYPDLYCYFDASDSRSPINHFAMCAFTAYPNDIGGLPAHGIRGNVLVIRLEPPRHSTALSSSAAPRQYNTAEYEETIGVEELRDTLLFYTTQDAAAIARERDMQRTMGDVPPEFLAQMMAQGGGPIDLGTFTMP